MKRILGILTMGFFFVGMVACGGSSGGGTTPNGDTTIDGLSDVADDTIDPKEYDLTTSSVIGSSISAKGLSYKVAAAGSFSRAGCEANRIKKNIIRNAIMPRMVLCFVRSMEIASGVEAAGDGVFNYWKMVSGLEGEGPPGIDDFSPRTAMKKVGSQFIFVMCNGGEKAMEFVLDTSNSQYNGHVIDIWGDGRSSMMRFAIDGTGPDDFTTATFTQSFSENSASWTGFGSQTLEATPTYSTVYGYYNDQGIHDFAGAAFARFDAIQGIGQGTAKFRQDSASWPGQTVEEMVSSCVTFSGAENCGTAEETLNYYLNAAAPQGCALGATAESLLCFSPDSDCPTITESGSCEANARVGSVDSFTIDSTNPLSLIFADAASSIYEDVVTAAVLQDSSEEPTIEFTSASADVDCSISDSWTAPTFASPPDMAECQALGDEMNQWDTGQLCEQLEGQMNTAGAGQEQQQQGPPQ